MPQTLTEARLAATLRPGAQVWWPGCAGHSPLFESWLRARPEAAAGVHFSGVWIPGVNRFDPTALHPEASATSYFMTPELRAGRDRGVVELRPWHYSQIDAVLSSGREPADVLLLHVAPPDAHGRCSLALAADFTPAVLAGAGPHTQVLVHVNPLLPRTSGPSVAVERIDAWVRAEAPALQVADRAPGAAMQALARQVAGLIQDHDTLQFGLGKLQAAVLAELAHPTHQRRHRSLRIHSGMVSDGVLALLHAGVLASPDAADPPIVTGVALGGAALYEAVADARWVRFAPVSHTHAQATLAQRPQFVAINSALQVDLLGNVNCEWLHGRQVSGVGGCVDFVRGARASAGGRAIVALNATAGGNGSSSDSKNSTSRIVPLLAPGTTGLARADVDIVATEQGVAHLRGLGVEERAQALLALADPAHQGALREAWHTLKRSL